MKYYSCHLATDNDDQIKSKIKVLSIKIKFPGGIFKPGNYKINIKAGVANLCTFQSLEEVLSFDVHLLSKPSSFTSYSLNRPGKIISPLIWNTTKR
ncbi:MAG: hypothetical protein IPL49_11130 [Saprospirales bacterium]|nr:hypothetical protein [Saprospirales bacterium]